MLTHNLLNQVSNSIKLGFEKNLSPKGTLHITFDEGDHPYDAYIIINDEQIESDIGFAKNTISSIYLNAKNAELFSNGRLDIRDPYLYKELKVRGDLGFLHSLMSMCQKPTQKVIEILDSAKEKTLKNNFKKVKTINGAPNSAQIIESIDDGCPTVFSNPSPESKSIWNFSSLKEKYGDCRFSYGKKGLIRDLIDHMLEGETVYSQGCALPNPMFEDFQILEPTDNSLKTGPLQLWMGSASKNLVTGLHREVYVPILSQVIGHKKLILYSPDQEDLVYAQRAHNKYQQCWIDLDNPDLIKFPKFKNAQELVVDLFPGDVLVIPPGWFHSAYAITNVMSISTVIHDVY